MYFLFCLIVAILWRQMWKPLRFTFVFDIDKFNMQNAMVN
jgi:hypothetical protein